MNLSVSVFLFLVLWSSDSLAQQAPTVSCDVPIVVTRFDTVFQELDTKDFLVHVGTSPVALRSASIDSGPKRVALILDASRYVQDKEWVLETQMAAVLVGHARPFDSFALVLVGRENTTQGFLSPAEARERLQELGPSRPSGTDSTERVYDALLEAAKHLDPPRFGDVLVLFGHMYDVGSKTDPDRLLALIMKARLRILGFDFEDPLPTTLPPGFDPNSIPPESSAPQKISKMVAETGYYFSFHGMEVLGRPGQLQLLEGFLGDVYRRIAEPYRLSAPAFATKGRLTLGITVANSEGRKIRPTDLHYPQFVFPCATPPAAPR